MQNEQNKVFCPLSRDATVPLANKREIG